MLLRLTLGLSLACALPGAYPAAQDGPRVERQEQSLRAAWAELDASARRDAIEWLRQELVALDSLQVRTLRAWLAQKDRDPGLWPAPVEAPFYDPTRHAPAQPIARKRLEPSSKKARAEVQRILGEPDPNALRAAWLYDWSSGDVRFLGGHDDPDRLFENALHGYPPELDLGLALCLRALDRGGERRALAAFAHAYTDRAGGVYPFTLYEAWNSGATLEMPDVDVLGIVHEVLDDWSTWVAPVPAKRHDRLYGRVSELFVAARRYRALREALADCLLVGEPRSRAGAALSQPRLHALWAAHEAQPAPLAQSLSDAVDAQVFMERWNERCQRESRWDVDGAGRMQRLSSDGRKVVVVLAAVLTEMGVLRGTGQPGLPSEGGGAPPGDQAH
jgi:hypothetical protein